MSHPLAPLRTVKFYHYMFVELACSVFYPEVDACVWSDGSCHKKSASRSAVEF